MSMWTPTNKCNVSTLIKRPRRPSFEREGGDKAVVHPSRHCLLGYLPRFQLCYLVLTPRCHLSHPTPTMLCRMTSIQSGSAQQGTASFTSKAQYPLAATCIQIHQIAKAKNHSNALAGIINPTGGEIKVNLDIVDTWAENSSFAGAGIINNFDFTTVSQNNNQVLKTGSSSGQTGDKEALS